MAHHEDVTPQRDPRLAVGGGTCGEKGRLLQAGPQQHRPPFSTWSCIPPAPPAAWTRWKWPLT